MSEYERKGCGSHSCVIQKPIGVGTNGPCTCRDWKLKAEISRLQAENERLREENAKLKQPDFLSILAYESGYKSAIQEAADYAEKLADEYQKSEGMKYPEFKTDAESALRDISYWLSKKALNNKS